MLRFRSLLVALLVAIAASGSAMAATACPATGTASGCCDEKHTSCPMAGPACRIACAPAMIPHPPDAAATRPPDSLLLFSAAAFHGEGRSVRPPLPPPRPAAS
jgi:hypothetical protein